jgi:hypothetical protein
MGKQSKRRRVAAPAKEPQLGGQAAVRAYDNAEWMRDKEEIFKGKLHTSLVHGRLHGPNCATWPSILTENPYQSPELGQRCGPIL